MRVQGEKREIEDPTRRRDFMLGGDSIFTVVSPNRGRFTYKVTAGDPEKRPVWFVSVLTGPDNTSDYTYIGFIGQNRRWFRGKAQGSQRPSGGSDAPSVVSFAWVWDRVRRLHDLGKVELWHEGRCGRCSRPLTVPLSVETGFGPTCRRKLNGQITSKE